MNCLFANMRMGHTLLRLVNKMSRTCTNAQNVCFMLRIIVGLRLLCYMREIVGFSYLPAVVLSFQSASRHTTMEPRKNYFRLPQFPEYRLPTCPMIRTLRLCGALTEQRENADGNEEELYCSRLYSCEIIILYCGTIMRL